MSNHFTIQELCAPVLFPYLRRIKGDAPDRFWASVEPYCADITENDLALLKEVYVWLLCVFNCVRTCVAVPSLCSPPSNPKTMRSSTIHHRSVSTQHVHVATTYMCRLLAAHMHITVCV